MRRHRRWRTTEATTSTSTIGVAVRGWIAVQIKLAAQRAASTTFPTTPKVRLLGIPTPTPTPTPYTYTHTQPISPLFFLPSLPSTHPRPPQCAAILPIVPCTKSGSTKTTLAVERLCAASSNRVVPSHRILIRAFHSVPSSPVQAALPLPTAPTHTETGTPCRGTRPQTLRPGPTWVL